MILSYLKDYIVPTAVVLISALSFYISIYAARKSTAKQNYVEQDKQYADLLKMAIADPDLRDPKAIATRIKSDEKFAMKYNNYANLVWNCMETFFDLSTAHNTKRFFIFKRHTVDKTWAPVIMEESRIHNEWLKYNQRLFKKSFRDYINSLNDIKIREGDLDDIDAVYDLMLDLFPANELKSRERIRELLRDKKYILFVAESTMLHGKDGILGFALVYSVPKYNSLWLDYFGTNPSYQNSGYGTLLFNYMLSTIKDGHCNIFMELEIPTDKNYHSPENARIRFYERNGVKILPIDYRLPTNENGVPMYIAYRPSAASMPLSNTVLAEIIKIIFNDIHKDSIYMQKTLDYIIKKLVK